MLGGTERRGALPGLVALLLIAAATAGCIGDAGDPAEAEQGDELDAASTQDTEPDNQTQETIVERTFALEGSGHGVGTAATGSNFWIVGSGIFHDISVPDTFQGGTLTFSWDAAASQGGMWLWVRDSGQNHVHVFQADSSPFEVELDPGDERLKGAAEIVVIPDQGLPATAHVDAQWTGELTLLVPQT